jgi:hypothetical protein
VIKPSVALQYSAGGFSLSLEPVIRRDRYFAAVRPKGSSTLPRVGLSRTALAHAFAAVRSVRDGGEDLPELRFTDRLKDETTGALAVGLRFFEVIEESGGCRAGQLVARSSEKRG